MLSEGGEKIPFIMLLPLRLTRAGIERGAISIIRSGQKDTEASIKSRVFISFY